MTNNEISGDDQSYDELEWLQRLSRDAALRTVSQRLAAAFNRHDVAALVQLYSPDQTTILPGMEPVRGREAKAALVAGFIRAFPDLALDLRPDIVSGNSVVCEGVMTGTHTGPLVSHSGEVPPTGRRLELPVVYILTVGADGLIETDRTYFDNATFAAQLGLG